MHSVEISGIYSHSDFMWNQFQVINLPFLAILGHWILIIWWISAFKKCKSSWKSKFKASKCVKTADFALLQSLNQISRKIWVIEKSWNFHTVVWKLLNFPLSAFWQKFRESNVLLRQLIGSLIGKHSTTVWKFHDFSITQILREINFGASRSTESTILIHLETQNFDFYEFLHFLKAGNYQLNKSPSPWPWNGKNRNFRTSRLS